jgi:hypothetical protein
VLFRSNITFLKPVIGFVAGQLIESKIKGLRMTDSVNDSKIDVEYLYANMNGADLSNRLSFVGGGYLGCFGKGNNADIVPDAQNWLKTSYTETRSNILSNIGSNSKDETIFPQLDAARLKAVGYSEVTISVRYLVRAEEILSVSASGQRLQIASYGKTGELCRRDTKQNELYGEHELTVTVDIDLLQSSACNFMLLWSSTAGGKISVGERTVTIFAS